ncbi:putative bifunctional diguanylate cyclase/phosphodiesterase [Marinomonas epiphytica]
MVFAFPYHPEKQLKIYWFIFMCLVFLVRYWDMRIWKTQLKDHDYDVKTPLNRFVAIRYVSAFSLGAYSILFMPSMELIELVCTLVIMSAMAGGAITVLAAHKGLTYSYAPILLLPVSAQCLLAPEGYMNTLGVLGVIFTLVIFSSAKSAHQFTIKSIKMKHQNSDLLEQMALKNQEIVEANASLESQVKKRTEKILELSNLDALTKLSNRHAFTQHLNHFIDRCQASNTQLALLFVDLDGFKGINDAHGHSVGDDLLVVMANRLSLQVEPQHVCRWGGDEFLLALENTDENAAIEFAQQLICFLSKPVLIEHNELTVGATIGIAMYPDHSVSATELIALSDTAMYVKKQSAKSEVCVFNEHMKQAIQRQAQLREGLAQAIKNNEIFVVFQPVIDVQSNTVSFCEALLRWRYQGQLVSPMEFIPAAEKHGLIHSIGEWVLQESCNMAANWCFDRSVHLSVNISVAQVMKGDLVSQVQQALQQSGFPSTNLHLEITESIFAEDINFVIDQVRALQAIGVKVSIDDFGTGFSSLALLQSLSADIVKIDRRFIQSWHEGGMAIIQATQYIADELGYRLVIEGVESQQQVDSLKALGIECIQGFYFSQPMPVEALPAWLEAFSVTKIAGQEAKTVGSIY